MTIIFLRGVRLLAIILISPLQRQMPGREKGAIGSASKPLQSRARSGLHQLQQDSSLYKQAEYTTAPILQTTCYLLGFW
jgi:hypothetical protein